MLFMKMNHMSAVLATIPVATSTITTTTIATSTIAATIATSTIAATVTTSTITTASTSTITTTTDTSSHTVATLLTSASRLPATAAAGPKPLSTITTAIFTTTALVTSTAAINATCPAVATATTTGPAVSAREFEPAIGIPCSAGIPEQRPGGLGDFPGGPPTATLSAPIATPDGCGDFQIPLDPEHDLCPLALETMLYNYQHNLEYLSSSEPSVPRYVEPETGLWADFRNYPMHVYNIFHFSVYWFTEFLEEVVPRIATRGQRPKLTPPVWALPTVGLTPKHPPIAPQPICIYTHLEKRDLNLPL
ncbi:hypothetical protein Pelo_4318 [Pelomyxa schiedti]|nr:hypothetical protein Pelo_4318 [Pelomyxa schiedti]